MNSRRTGPTTSVAYSTDSTASWLYLPMTRSPLKVLDLFSGAGGMALGFEAAGCRAAGAVEIDSPSAETFARMFAREDPRVFGGPQEGDMTLLEPASLLDRLGDEPDLLVGGPPCQGFSRVGRAKQASLLAVSERTLHGGVRDPSRNLLYKTFIAVLEEAKPLAFVMENVPGMREIVGTDIAARIAREAAHCGYNVRYFLLNAAWYGVPQQRWRIFFVGLRRDLGPAAVPEPPARTHITTDEMAGAQLKKPEGVTIPEDPWMLWGDGIPVVPQPQSAVTTREALADLPKLTSHLQGIEARDAKLPLRREPSEWASALRTWPGRAASDTVSGNWYRFNPRDFPIFRRMAHGDRYPEALVIAEDLFHERLAELKCEGRAPTPGGEGLEEAPPGDHAPLPKRCLPRQVAQACPLRTSMDPDRALVSGHLLTYSLSELPGSDHHNS